MIYADRSFLVSFYAWDQNSAFAARAYQADARRPLLDAGRVRYAEADWRDSLRLAEELSEEHTETTGAAAGNL